MKFLIDHDVPAEVGWLLQHWGHETTLVKDVLSATATDEEIFRFGRSKNLTIISCNRDHFIALARQAIEASVPFAGLVILIRRRSRQAECARLLRLLRQAGEIGLGGNINFA